MFSVLVIRLRSLRFFFSSRSRHTIFDCDWSSDVCSSDLRVLDDGHHQPERGRKDAKVTIVEYSDFQCPFCARVYATLENDVLKDYGDKVRFVFKNFPLTSIHPWAGDAALASECAFQQGNDKFWAMYNGLFSKQSDITRENLKDRAGDIARDARLDVARFQECFDGKKAQDAVDADVHEAAALGVNSTPTFFVNGRRLSGALAPADLKQAIDRELGAKG